MKCQPLSCQSFQPRLQALLDSRQSIDADRQVSEHIEACPECATLAAAYAAVARVPGCATHSASATQSASVNGSAHINGPAPIAGLADRVMAELQTPSANVRPKRRAGAESLAKHGGTKHSSIRWKQTVAVLAASLLVAVGIGLQQGTNNGADVQQPSTTNSGLATGGLATDNATLVAPTPAVNVPGQDILYRAGQGLASISLVGMRSRSARATEPEPTGNEQGSPPAWEIFRTLLPREGETPSPTQGETGFFVPSSGVLLA